VTGGPAAVTRGLASVAGVLGSWRWQTQAGVGWQTLAGVGDHSVGR
jgi:hypothetical protein